MAATPRRLAYLYCMITLSRWKSGCIIMMDLYAVHSHVESHVQLDQELIDGILCVRPRLRD